MNSFRQHCQRLWKAEPFSPKSFIRRAMGVSILFGAVHLAGLREYTTFLSGTSANPAMSWQTAALLGCIYIFLYLSFIVVVPTWLIGAALLAAWNRRRNQNK
jgi:membrane protein DedA with SNARE-associated domain